MGSRQPHRVRVNCQNQSAIVRLGDRDGIRPALGLADGGQLAVVARPHRVTALFEFGVVTGNYADFVTISC